MLILIIFSFIAGIVTILSPCILPILPIVLSGSVTGGKRRPLGVVTGFILSFTFFTLFLTSLVRTFGIPADSLRTFSIVVVFLFGLSLLLPQTQAFLERLFSKVSSLTPTNTGREGFWGGFLIGLSIGLVWTPCVGPILGSVISLALTGTVTGSAFFITLAYSAGTAIPMLAIVWGGRRLLDKIPWLSQNTTKIQKAFGVLMILTAIAIMFNYDRKFQAYVLNKFPNYGTGLTSIEEVDIVEENLDRLRDDDTEMDEEDVGKPMNELLSDQSNKAPELIPGGKWYNTSTSSAQNLPQLAEEGSAIESLKGKVVLIDFWTYTCINCIRTLPYLRDWHDKYSDDGLVIIGVHTPEFEFEKDPDNVKEAIDDFELEYIVMQDNNYETWRAYNNRYWPAKYLIDKEGYVRYTHFGEGEYDETEEAIQKLLEETGREVNEQINNPDYTVQTRTPELYLGYKRMSAYFSPGAIEPDELKTYESPETLPANRFSFNGEWLVEEERSIAGEGSSLKLHYFSKDVFLVMRSADGEPKDVKVILDGEEVDEDQAGKDVIDSVVEVEKDRLYHLVNLKEPGEHELILEFPDGSTEAYAFTFG